MEYGRLKEEDSTYHEYVVPRSMPMMVPMSSFAFSANACGKAAAMMRNTTVFFIVILTLRCIFFMDYLSSVTMSSLLYIILIGVPLVPFLLFVLLELLIIWET